MVIGGLLGAGHLAAAGAVRARPARRLPAPFVIVAMMALFGSIAHAPLAVMLMVAEMTGNLGMLAPAMIAVGLATVVVGEKSIYASQLGNRSESPAHRFRFATPLLASIGAAEAMRTPRVVLGPDQRADEAVAALERVHAPGAPVVVDGKLLGVATYGDLRDAPADTLVRRRRRSLLAGRRRARRAGRSAGGVHQRAARRGFPSCATSASPASSARAT